jgi:hypothetical protein
MAATLSNETAGLLRRRSPTPVRGAESALWFVVVGTVALAVAAGSGAVQPVFVLAPAAIALILVAGQRLLLSWQTMLGAIIAVIIFVPIRRYTIGGGGPVALEPYRVLIAVVLSCWFLALAADPDVRWRPSGYGGPTITLFAAILLSMALNLTRVEALNAIVLKQLTFFVSYFLVMSYVASVVHTRQQLDRLLGFLVLGGATVAVFALYEWRTGHNYFNELGRLVPLLHYQDQGTAEIRGTGVRAMGSAQHPIALGAALVMLLPIALYLYQRTTSRIWLACGAVLTLAALATGSRTAAVMLVVLFVCFLWTRRAETIRLLPHICVLLVLVQGVMPGTIGTFRGILQPSYLIKEQSQDQGTGTGRLADLGPGLKEWSATPLFGEGFGTRVTDQDAGVLGSQQILDDQWLGSLLQIGAVGVVALGWLFLRAIRRLSRAARCDSTPHGWLMTGLASSLTGFFVGMFTFDAFAFIQVTFLAFILLAFAGVALRLANEEKQSPS